MKTDLRLLYFISNQLNIETIRKKNISKFYNILCVKIMKQMDIEWNNNFMALEPCINGKSQVKNESKVININNENVRNR